MGNGVHFAYDPGLCEVQSFAAGDLFSSLIVPQRLDETTFVLMRAVKALTLP